MKIFHVEGGGKMLSYENIDKKKEKILVKLYLFYLFYKYFIFSSI